MTAATATAAARPVPRIRLWSWLGLESLAWAAVIGHIVKWAVDCWYYASTQLQWGFYAPKTGDRVNLWNLVDIWDHLPYWTGRLANNMGVRTAWTTWLMLKTTDHGWTEPRHLARGVLIGLVAGVIVQMLFAKPQQYGGDDVSAWQYVFALPKAILYAIPGCAVIGLVAYFLPWLTSHGLEVRGDSVAANEINGWLTAGTWIGIAMGIAGSLFFAKYASRRPAQEAQWFYAERSAAKLRSTTGLSQFRTRVLGTPSHRVRVRWLIGNDVECEPRGPWTVILLTGVAAFVLISAGAGAYITLAGPAAGAH